MDRSVQPLTTWPQRHQGMRRPHALVIAGTVAAGLPLLLAVFAIAGLLVQAPGGSLTEALGALSSDAYLWRVARFTVLQAGLSAIISVALAVPVALALSGLLADGVTRRWLLVLFAVPLALPQIVTVIGITAVWGEQGAITQTASAIGVDLPSIYGLTGILMAHVFFNMPLAARLILGALDTVPGEYHRLADQLGLSGFSRFRIVTLPVIRRSAGEALALVFMLCVTSFAVVLTLGGGPRATTLEVALYQALAFDFDLARAVLLTFVQLGLTLMVVAAIGLSGGDAAAGDTTGLFRPVRARRSHTSRLSFGSLVLVLATLYVAAPIAAIVLKGIGSVSADLVVRADVRDALATSLAIAFASASLAVVAATVLAMAAAEQAAGRQFRGKPGFAEQMALLVPSLILVVPAMVIAAGWFIGLRAFEMQASAAPFIIVAVNAAMAMPFAARLVAPTLRASAERTDRLVRSLGVSGWDRWRLVTWPALRPSALAAFAFAMALSLGDLGVVALFGSTDLVTLPLLILRSMGSYRSSDAAALSFLLALLTMALSFLAIRLARHDRDGAAS